MVGKVDNGNGMTKWLHKLGTLMKKQERLLQVKCGEKAAPYKFQDWVLQYSESGYWKDIEGDCMLEKQNVP